MDEIEELYRNKLQCEKCHKPYNGESVVCIYTTCQHHSCASCCASMSTLHCPICKCVTTDAPTPFIKYMVTILKKYGSSNKRDFRYEIAFRENSVLKEKLSKFEAQEDHHKCVECEKCDYEQDMQLCETCHELKFEDLEDVKKNVLCPACAIKKHMRKGHHTVDFYPYFSAYNFSSQLPNIDSKSEEFKSAQELLNDTFTSFNALSANVSENYNMLTDMAQRSKSTKQQVEIFEKMERFMDQSKSINVETAFEVKKRTMKLEDNLTKIKKWCENRLGDCVDESEIIKLPK